METALKMLQELLALQTANVTDSAKRQAREKIIEFFTTKNELNWQDVATPYDIVREMLDLIPSDAENFIVFFSMEFLEEMVKSRGIDPKKILFISDNSMEATFSRHSGMYGVETVIMSKAEGYQDGKLIFPERIFNFCNEVNMKFGKLAVIGNPPYQINNDNGGNTTHASALYHKFIEASIDGLNPDYISMIVPSRWMIGGRGLDEHRERMMNDKRMKKIVHFSGEREVFPSVSIKGGVNYFLWQKDHSGTCEFVVGNSTTNRHLNQYDIILQDNNAVGILEKVRSTCSDWMNKSWAGQTPFGIVTSFKNWQTSGTKCIKSGLEEKFVNFSDFTDKHNIIGKWKVCTSKANGAAQEDNGNGKKVISDAFVIDPNAICTQTYVVVNVFDSKQEAENFISYMKTKFFRFMLGLRVLTMDINKKKFAWVPDVSDYSAPWTDKELYKKFNLSRQEIAYIESKIKEIK